MVEDSANITNVKSHGNMLYCDIRCWNCGNCASWPYSVSCTNFSDITKVIARHGPTCSKGIKLNCPMCNSKGYLGSSNCEHGMSKEHYYCIHGSDMPKDSHLIYDN